MTPPSSSSPYVRLSLLERLRTDATRPPFDHLDCSPHSTFHNTPSPPCLNLHKRTNSLWSAIVLSNFVLTSPLPRDPLPASRCPVAARTPIPFAADPSAPPDPRQEDFFRSRRHFFWHIQRTFHLRELLSRLVSVQSVASRFGLCQLTLGGVCSLSLKRCGCRPQVLKPGRGRRLEEGGSCCDVCGSTAETGITSPESLPPVHGQSAGSSKETMLRFKLRCHGRPSQQHDEPS